MVKVLEQNDSKGASKLIPVLFAGGKLCPASLIGAIAKLEDLMDEKRKQVKDKEVHRQAVPSMPIVVFDMVALVL